MLSVGPFAGHTLPYHPMLIPFSINTLLYPAVRWLLIPGPFAVLGFILSGCAHSEITAFRDLAFATKQFESIVVFAQGMTLDNAVEFERQLCEKVAPTPCVSGQSVLPPTRQYTAEEVQHYLAQSGADGVLFIGLVADQTDTRYMGTITSSSASGSINFYGNSAYWSSTGQSASTPVYSSIRVAFGQLALFDRRSGDIAWRGEIKVTGKGKWWNRTDSAFISSATSKIVRELKEAGLIGPPLDPPPARSRESSSESFW